MVPTWLQNRPKLGSSWALKLFGPRLGPVREPRENAAETTPKQKLEKAGLTPFSRGGGGRKLILGAHWGGYRRGEEKRTTRLKTPTSGVGGYIYIYI